MLKVCTITREAIRNQLIFCLSHACGLRVTELASITIRDIMMIGGTVKSELTLRSSYTKNAHARTVPMPEGTLTKHLELYLDYRLEKGIGTSGNTAEFRGLLPDLPVIFSSRGGGFAMAAKKRVLESGESETYLAADALEQLFRDLYQMGGLTGASSHSGRRSYATRLVEGGVDIEDVSRLLGHTDLDFTRIYVEPSKENIRLAFESALELDPSVDYDAIAASRKLEYEATSEAEAIQEGEGDAKKASEQALGIYRKLRADKMAGLICSQAVDITSELASVPADILQQISTAKDVAVVLKAFEVNIQSGVYFLINEVNEIVYVGQSKNVMSRIGSHLGDKNKSPHFSKVSAIPVPLDQLDEVEQRFIQELRPRLNKRGNGDWETTRNQATILLIEQSRKSRLQSEKRRTRIGTGATIHLENNDKSRKTEKTVFRRKAYSKQGG